MHSAGCESDEKIASAIEYEGMVRASAMYLRPLLEQTDTVIVCGSGLGECIRKQVQVIADVAYKDIPNFPVSTVKGHAGRLLVGMIAGRKCAVMMGRWHYYEGHSMRGITLPVRAMAASGVTRIIITNACGGISRELKVGDIVMIADHIAFPCMAGATPLRGPDVGGGERFPGMTNLWETPEPVKFKRATYAFITGPQFETAAEVRALRLLGADIVGMSTVPEAIAAKHCGMRIAGLSLVTNMCIDSKDGPHEPSHSEVLANSALAADKFAGAVVELLNALG
jgi:purine-nucleoside phosphorylase